MQTRAIIEAAINNDATATPEQRKRILAALNEKPEAKTAPKLITRKQAAEILGGVCVETVKRYEKRGLLRQIRFTARRVRLDEAQVIEVARNGVERVQI
jgi:hypothetical protein